MRVNKLLLIILLISVTGFRISSQHLVAGFSAGAGSYSMKDLKSLNEAVTPSFDCKLVSDFPPYLYYQFSLNLKMEKFSIGSFYSFQSTGSRISAKDYSGEYYFDTRVGSGNLGIYAAINLMSKKTCQLSVYAKPGITLTKLDLSEYFTVLDTVFADFNLQCRANSFSLEPGIDFSCLVLPSVSIGINAGYFLQMGGQDFYIDGEKESILVNPRTGKKLKPGWNGFRFGISVMYNLKLKAHATITRQETSYLNSTKKPAE